jgi:hypothetical protein
MTWAPRAVCSILPATITLLGRISRVLTRPLAQSEHEIYRELMNEHLDQMLDDAATRRVERRRGRALPGDRHP